MRTRAHPTTPLANPSPTRPFPQPPPQHHHQQQQSQKQQSAYPSPSESPMIGSGAESEAVEGDLGGVGVEDWQEEWNEVTTASPVRGERSGVQAVTTRQVQEQDYRAQPPPSAHPQTSYFPEPSPSYPHHSYPVSAPPTTDFSSYTNYHIPPSHSNGPYYPHSYSHDHTTSSSSYYHPPTSHPEPQQDDKRLFSTQTIIDHGSPPPDAEEQYEGQVGGGDDEMVTVWAPVMMSRRDYEASQREELGRSTNSQGTVTGAGLGDSVGYGNASTSGYPDEYHYEIDNSGYGEVYAQPQSMGGVDIHPSHLVDTTRNDYYATHQQPDSARGQQQIHPPPPTPEYYNTHLQHHQETFQQPHPPPPQHAQPPPSNPQSVPLPLDLVPEFGEDVDTTKSNSLSPWESASHNMARVRGEVMDEASSSVTSWATYDETGYENSSTASWQTAPQSSVTSWSSANGGSMTTPKRSHRSSPTKGKAPTTSTIALARARAAPYSTSSASTPSFSVPPLPVVASSHPHLLPKSNVLPPRPDKGKSHARKASVNHIPRPRNSFILFRSHTITQKLVPTELKDHKSVSKIVGELWKSLTVEERRVWEVLADEEKRQHKVEYPNYVYKPKPVKEGSRKRPGAMLSVLKGDDNLVKVEEGDEEGVGPSKSKVKKPTAAAAAAGQTSPRTEQGDLLVGPSTQSFSESTPLQQLLFDFGSLPPMPHANATPALEQHPATLFASDPTASEPAPELRRSQSDQPQSATSPGALTSTPKKARSSAHQRPKLSPSHSSPSSVSGTPFKHSRLARRGSYTVNQTSPGGDSQSSSNNPSPQSQRMEQSTSAPTVATEKKAGFASLGISAPAPSPFISKDFDNKAFLTSESKGIWELRRGSMRDVSVREKMAQVEEEQPWKRTDREPTFALETKDFLEKAGLVEEGDEGLDEETTAPPAQPHFPTSSRNPTPPTTFASESDDLFSIPPTQQPREVDLFQFGSTELFAPPAPAQVQATGMVKTSHRNSLEVAHESSVGNGSFDSEPDLDAF